MKEVNTSPKLTLIPEGRILEKNHTKRSPPLRGAVVVNGPNGPDGPNGRTSPALATHLVTAYPLSWRNLSRS